MLSQSVTDWRTSLQERLVTLKNMKNELTNISDTFKRKWERQKFMLDQRYCINMNGGGAPRWKWGRFLGCSADPAVINLEPCREGFRRLDIHLHKAHTHTSTFEQREWIHASVFTHTRRAIYIATGWIQASICTPVRRRKTVPLLLYFQHLLSEELKRCPFYFQVGDYASWSPTCSIISCLAYPYITSTTYPVHSNVQYAGVYCMLMGDHLKHTALQHILLQGLRCWQHHLAATAAADQLNLLHRLLWSAHSASSPNNQLTLSFTLWSDLITITYAAKGSLLHWTTSWSRHEEGPWCVLINLPEPAYDHCASPNLASPRLTVIILPW